MPDSKTWTWGNEGVTLEADHLLWFQDVQGTSYASGAACEQTFADFAANGPHVSGVPEDIVKSLTESISARSSPPTAAERGAEPQTDTDKR